MDFKGYLEEKITGNPTYDKLVKQTFKNWDACDGFVEGDPPEPTPEPEWTKDSEPLGPDPCDEEIEEDVDETPTLDSGFVAKLIDYLEKSFPSHGKMNSDIRTELKKTMPVGNEEKMKEVDRVKKKVNDIVSREKKRFLDRVSGKVEDIKIKAVENKKETEEEK